MGTRENKVETYLNDRVIQIGGITEKWGMNKNPDRIVIVKGAVLFVEVKTEDGNFQPGQERKHERLKKHGALVFTVYGHAGVDLFINGLINGFNR